MVEGDELGDEGERLTGDGHLGGRDLGEVLQLAHRLPADEADEAACEGRMPVLLGRAPVGVERVDGRERARRHLAREGACLVEPVVDPHGAVAVGVATLREHAERARADERPARPDAALFRRLEQEGARSRCGDLAVDADGRLAVGEELPQHGHDAVSRGDGGVELGSSGGGHAVASEGSPIAGSRGSTSKQLCEPV